MKLSVVEKVIIIQSNKYIIVNVNFAKNKMFVVTGLESG